MDLNARYDEKGVYPFEKIKPIVEEILQVPVFLVEYVYVRLCWRFLHVSDLDILFPVHEF